MAGTGSVEHAVAEADEAENERGGDAAGLLQVLHGRGQFAIETLLLGEQPIVDASEHAGLRGGAGTLRRAACGQCAVGRYLGYDSGGASVR